MRADRGRTGRRGRWHCQLAIGELCVKMRAICRISVGEGRTLSRQGRVAAGACPGTPDGRLPGKPAGSLNVRGHLPSLTGACAQVSGEIYLSR